MRSFLLALLASAAVTATGNIASAADDCGWGWKREKHRCIPYDERQSQQRYGGPRYYDDGPRYDRGYDEPRYYRGGGGYDGVPRGGPGEPAIRGRCVAGFTSQDGICKPYRGG